MTQEQIEEFKKLRSDGMSIQKACRSVGIATGSYYHAVEKGQLAAVGRGYTKRAKPNTASKPVPFVQELKMVSVDSLMLVVGSYESIVRLVRELK